MVHGKYLTRTLYMLICWEWSSSISSQLVLVLVSRFFVSALAEGLNRVLCWMK